MKIEQGVIRIRFDSGKAIDFSPEEIEELKQYFKEVVYIPSPIPPIINPTQPFPPTVTWQNYKTTDNSK